MQFQSTKYEQPLPLTHQWQYHTQEITQMIVWISNQFWFCITCPIQTAFECIFAWMWKGYVNPDRVSFWLGLHFLRPAQFLVELVHPNERNQLGSSTPFATAWIVLQTPFFDCVASYLLHMAFSLTENCFNVSFSRDTWYDNHSGFFSMSLQTVYFGNVNALPLLSPINWLT